MRNYGAYFAVRLNDELHHYPDWVACWSALSRDLYWPRGGDVRKHLLSEDIYIWKFEEEETKKYQDLLVSIINEITPCNFVELDIKFNQTYSKNIWGVAGIDDSYNVKMLELINQNHPKRFIKFRLLDTYDKSLILLNFIRNLWNEPVTGYSVHFFKFLAKCKEKDPLAKLTWANKEACAKTPSTYSYGHSNAHKADTLVIKSKKDLLEWQQSNFGLYTTAEFLTNNAS